jgi:virulence-associated protein VapD
MTKDAKAPFTIEQRSIYAITFDLDDALRGEAQRILFEEGFTLQNGFLFVGDPKRIDVVHCILAARRLPREIPGFAEAVRNFRMFRIEEVNDLAPLLTWDDQPKTRTRLHPRARYQTSRKKAAWQTSLLRR